MSYCGACRQNGGLKQRCVSARPSGNSRSPGSASAIQRRQIKRFMCGWQFACMVARARRSCSGLFLMMRRDHMSSSTEVLSALDVALRVAEALDAVGCEYFVG